MALRGILERSNHVAQGSVKFGSIVRKWTLMGGGNPTSFHPRGAQRLEHKHTADGPTVGTTVPAWNIAAANVEPMQLRHGHDRTVGSDSSEKAQRRRRARRDHSR
jgi:hypothetical protein